jgi:peptidoglycan/xylan/chitin deacetylase (PgdA/CDA1 family)
VHELRDSRRALEAHLGHPVQWFAYPYGAEDSAVVALVHQAGYVLAVTTQGGTVQRGDEPLLLRREEVIDTTSVGDLAGLVGG